MNINTDRQFERFHKDYDINGRIVNGMDLTREDIAEWQQCREKIDWKYAHNYDHLYRDDYTMAMICKYVMSNIPLTTMEQRRYDEYRKQYRELKKVQWERKKEAREKKGKEIDI